MVSVVAGGRGAALVLGIILGAASTSGSDTSAQPGTVKTVSVPSPTVTATAEQTVTATKTVTARPKPAPTKTVTVTAKPKPKHDDDAGDESGAPSATGRTLSDPRSRSETTSRPAAPATPVTPTPRRNQATSLISRSPKARRSSFALHRRHTHSSRTAAALGIESADRWAPGRLSQLGRRPCGQAVQIPPSVAPR